MDLTNVSVFFSYVCPFAFVHFDDCLAVPIFLAIEMHSVIVRCQSVHKQSVWILILSDKSCNTAEAWRVFQRCASENSPFTLLHQLWSLYGPLLSSRNPWLSPKKSWKCFWSLPLTTPPHPQKKKNPVSQAPFSQLPSLFLLHSQSLVQTKSVPGDWSKSVVFVCVCVRTHAHVCVCFV